MFPFTNGPMCHPPERRKKIDEQSHDVTWNQKVHSSCSSVRAAEAAGPAGGEQRTSKACDRETSAPRSRRPATRPALRSYATQRPTSRRSLQVARRGCARVQSISRGEWSNGRRVLTGPDASRGVSGTQARGVRPEEADHGWGARRQPPARFTDSRPAAAPVKCCR